MIIRSLMALAMLSAAPAYGRELQLDISQTAHWVHEQQGCEKQSYLPWCAGVKVDGKPIDKAALTILDSRVRRTMIVRTDGDNGAWVSFYGEAKFGNRWIGDCDGLVATSIEYLWRQGYSLSMVRRLAVSTNGGRPNHIVALAWIDGEWIVFADSAVMSPYYPLSKMKWTPAYYAATNTMNWHPAFFSNP